MGIYQYPESSSVTEKDSLLYSDFIPIDIDSDDLDKALKDTRLIIEHLRDKYGIDISQIRLFFSGCKGFHIEIPSTLFGIVPCKNLPSIHKEIVKRIIPTGIQVDTKIYQRRGLLRIHNSINNKTNLYKIPIQVDELNNLNVNEIKEIAISKVESFLERMNRPADEIAEAVDKIESQDTFALGIQLKSLAQSLVVFAIIGLLVAAVMKKTNPDAE